MSVLQMPTTILKRTPTASAIRTGRRGQPERMSRLQWAILTEHKVAGGALDTLRSPPAGSLRKAVMCWIGNTVDSNGHLRCWIPLARSSYYRAIQALIRKGYMTRTRLACGCGCAHFETRLTEKGDQALAERGLFRPAESQRGWGAVFDPRSYTPADGATREARGDG